MALLAPDLPAGDEEVVVFPLSFAQQRLWFQERVEPGNPAFLVPRALLLEGALEPAILARCLAGIIGRHEVLRTGIEAVDGEPVQAVRDEVPSRLPAVDLGGLSAGGRRRMAEALARREARRPFALQRPPLLRATLVRLGGQRHLLLLTLHHLVSDAWSTGVLVRDTVALYRALLRGEPSPLPPLPVQYGDFAVWQRGRLTPAAAEAHLGYWRRQLAGVPCLDLPVDRPRGPRWSARGAAWRGGLDRGVSAALGRLSRQAGATPFMALLAAFQALLHRYSGQADLAVGTAVANRDRPELEGLIGLFANTLALRGDLSGDPSFSELLGRARRVALEAYEHQELPFERVVEALAPERDVSVPPLFQVMLSLQNAPRQAERLPALVVRPLDGEPQAVLFELVLFAEEGEEGIALRLEYPTALFDATTIERMGAHLRRLVAAAIAEPATPVSRLPLLGAAEAHALALEWGRGPGSAGPGSEGRGRDFVDALRARVAAGPDATALRSRSRQLSYGELERRSRHLAGGLVRRGAGPDVVVGVALDLSPGAVVAILGALATGGAYLALDLAYPPARRAFMLEDARVSLLVSRRGAPGAVPEGYGGEVLRIAADGTGVAGEASGTGASVPTPGEGLACRAPERLAYVIYTSGSTGRPKGVSVTHRGVLPMAEALIDCYRITPESRLLGWAAMGFDASVAEVLPTLLAGGTLCLASSEEALPGPAMAVALERWAITNLTLVPTGLNTLPARAYPALTSLVAAGEVFTAELAARWSRPRQWRLTNVYGPTEATVFSTAARIPGGDRPPPIGRAVAVSRLRLATRRLDPQPIGVPGELSIAGPGLARGYLGRPRLTAERFVPDPAGEEPGGRLYRTGDLIRFLADGSLDFLGRLDHQVKIRGFRIELGEIEAALAAHPGVEEAAVLARRSAAGDSELAAYLVAAGNAGERGALTGALRRWLRDRLPEHMVPGDLWFLEALPRTSSGKVDRRALPGLEAPAPSGGGALAPRDALELTLVRIWEEVLGRSPVGVRDDFFDLGGHSMLALRLAARFRSAFGRDLELAALYGAPTVEGLAAALRRDPAAAKASSLLVPLTPAGDGGGAHPLFLVHPAGGNVLCYVHLARALGGGRAVWGLQARGLEGGEPVGRLEEMADLYLAKVEEAAPAGPVLLGGWSFGGVVAFEMARRLAARGRAVPLVALMDVWAPSAEAVRTGAVDEATEVRAALAELWPEASSAAGEGDAATLVVRAVEAAKQAGQLPPDFEPARAQRYLEVYRASRRALDAYRPGVYPGRLTLFRAVAPAGQREPTEDETVGWAELARGGVEVHAVPATHTDMVYEPQVQILADELRACCARSAPRRPRP